MHAKTHHQKPHAKEGHNAAAPVPNFITQVNKEDEKKSHILDFFNINKCCALFRRCFPPKRQNFSQIDESAPPGLLEPQLPQFKGKKVLVLDLDETLVHSTFEPISNPDLVLPVRIQGMTYRINVMIRPGTEEFLARVGELFEVVVFTASLAEYAEPLVRILDTNNVVSSLLYRQHCTPLNGIYVKDLSLIGRDMKDIILIDNSPNSFLFQPENAYHIKNFFDDKSDRELVRLANFLEHLVEVDDVRPIEELRKKYEPQPGHKTMKFVKVQHESVEAEETSSIQAHEQNKQLIKKKEEREKTYNVETEPDLRKDDRESEFPLPPFSPKGTDKPNNKAARQNLPSYRRAAPLTERIVVSERWVDPALDSSVDIELPSPKESDALINHREADAYLENNSNETDTDKKKVVKQKPHIPPFLKSTSAIFASMNQKNESLDPTLEGHKVEDVRYLTGIDNLNSPVGKPIKIEFHNKMEV